MTSTSSPTQTLGEREQHLLALYRPPAVLKKQHKDLLKLIWSFIQGFDGTKVRCFSCGKIFAVEDATVHHADGNTRHNDFDNLSPACWSCNWTEGWLVRRRKVAEEREKKAAVDTLTTAHTITLPFATEQEARSHVMRTRMNRVLYDPQTGIAREEGFTTNLKILAAWVVHEVGVVRNKLGTSQTYEKYIRDDLAGGIWRQPDADNLEEIERTSKPFPFPESQRLERDG